MHQGTIRRARDASQIAPRDRYRYPTEYRALKTRCRGRPSEAKCTPHRDDPKIQTQMTAPCLTRSTLRGRALGNASRTGRTPPTTSSFQKVREETPKIKISRVCPGARRPQRKRGLVLPGDHRYACYAPRYSRLHRTTDLQADPVLTGLRAKHTASKSSDTKMSRGKSLQGRRCLH